MGNILPMNKGNWQKKAFSVLCLVFVMTTRSWSQTGVAEGLTDSVSLVQTVNNFVTSFSMLDWDRFAGYFEDSATAFFPPSARFTGRANNKTEIERVFKPFFDKVRSEKDHGPYLTIVPPKFKNTAVGDRSHRNIRVGRPGYVRQTDVSL
ncbi:hypothetical protein Q4E93_33705 [Flavitalea sp. BT771]|uniref:hypothetical protein n=1 Tax=Flavitalea sp. BT771 TaxID=3063329 RepID=UPI0026E36855|nr:hypothetical protein [Flavitalea sp. BT771]MDO6435618.1 hypothetical protein [Flavitalea sp. BT771]MDV6224518.1 hypothetical protein [Flavitalea sp. BT771]